MLQIKSFTFNAFQENTYLVHDEYGNGVLIDPGCFDDDEKTALSVYILSQGIRLSHILNTHCHIDHVLGNAWAKRTFNSPILIHPLEIPVLKSVEIYAPNYGFSGYESSEADGFLTEGDNIMVGKEVLNILFVPGHAPGHVAFYHEASARCIAGDTLFRTSIGRTDLPGGNHELLISKIKSELLTLSDETIIFPGHGPQTSISFEKSNNPFVGKKANY